MQRAAGVVEGKSEGVGRVVGPTGMRRRMERLCLHNGRRMPC
jgi:hypothetical protein